MFSARQFREICIDFSMVADDVGRSPSKIMIEKV